MRVQARRLSRTHAPQLLLLAGAALLAAHPLAWLISTWNEPAYNSQGLWIALGVGCLACWSFISEQQPDTDLNRRYAWTLLVISAAVRMVGQLLRVNVVGALTLSLDVYALATLGGLKQRRRSVSPFWLSLLFAVSLPAERVIQRLFGYALQYLSAGLSCGLLDSLRDGVSCIGNRILVDGADVLVDLPCSGARGLLSVLTLYALLSALRSPPLGQALLGFVIALLSALAANVLRLCLLALGLASEPLGIDFAGNVAHEALGLVCLALAAVPLLLWARALPARRAPGATPALRHAPRLDEERGSRRGLPFALGFCALAALVVSLPARPLDVAHAVGAPGLPTMIGGYAATPQSLSDTERSYFSQFGGGAVKAGYGPYGLLLVRTAAPLRHLHSPEECLRGAGHRVRYLGLVDGELPTALYRATDPQGREWRVSVSYVSDRGEHAAGIAQAVWLWLQHPDAVWSELQRIAPWDLPIDLARAWDDAALRALDLPVAPPTAVHLVPHGDPDA